MSGFALARGDERASLVGLLDELLDSGVHLAGDLSIGLADVELIRVALRLLVASEETASRTGRDPTHVAAAHTNRAPSTATARLSDARDPSTAVTRARPTSSAVHRDEPASVDARRGLPTSQPDDERQLADGVARLVLTIIAVIHDLVERQATRRVEAGTLTDDQVERLGVALAALEHRMADVRDAFGVTDADLDLDLGPLGHLR